MNASRIAAAGLLAAAAYAVWRRSGVTTKQDVASAWAPADVLDEVAETVTDIVGVQVVSSRYQRALADPANARIIAMLTAAEDRNGIPSGLLVRQAWQESRFNPMAVNTRSGAQGLMQFMPATAAEWGVSVFDAESSADGAARYMAWLYSKVGQWDLALAAYNWGIGNVMRKGMGSAPSETTNYVSQILSDLGWS